jgi:hypothetical protein
MEGSTFPSSFKHHPRLPQLWIAFMVTLPIVAVVAYTRPSETPPAPYSAWWIAGTCLALALLTGVLFTRASWGTVEVDEDGLHVHGRLVVPADRLGTIQLLSWSRAGDLGWFGRWKGRRLKSTQNLYGGGMGLGRGVVVEDVRPGQEPSLWLLPGPRVEELVQALASARDGAERRLSTGRR